MPRSDDAVRRMTAEIHRKKSQGYRAIKLIHGFGSSGVGGRIRVEARRALENLKRQGAIAEFMPGERFSIFDAPTRKAMDVVPELRADRDLDRHNNGITVVLL